MALNHEGWAALLDATDTKHDEAHQRLRKDFRELDDRVEQGLKLFHESLTPIKTKLVEVENTPVDATKLILRTPVVVSIVVVVLSIAGGMWASTSGLRESVREISAQMKADQRVYERDAKLLEINSLAISKAVETSTRDFKDAIKDVQQQQKLLGLQYNELNDKITRLTVARGR